MASSLWTASASKCIGANLRFTRAKRRGQDDDAGVPGGPAFTRSRHAAGGGVNPTREPRKLRNVIGVQLQSAGMPESMTPDEAMKFFCAYHNVAPRFDFLDRLGLAEKRKTQFGQLSTGLQRRLALALAIAHNPQVLFLDEPTAGLDVPSHVELHKMMRELKASGTTIILATHDMAEAEELSDQVAILLQGKIVTAGTPLEITAAGAGLTKVSVHTRDQRLLHNDATFPAVSQQAFKEPMPSTSAPTSAGPSPRSSSTCKTNRTN